MFKKVVFRERNVASPERMSVGQVCVRTIKSNKAKYDLRHKMYKAMRSGMEFSYEIDGDKYSIRRDK